MTAKKVLEWERKKLEKYQNFNLPNYCKKIGSAIILLAVITFFVHHFLFQGSTVLKAIMQTSLMFGLLTVALSRDVIEDELTKSLKETAYKMAFILGILYAIIQPYINYIVGRLFGNDNIEVLLEFSAVQIIIFMLLIQQGFFWLLIELR